MSARAALALAFCFAALVAATAVAQSGSIKGTITDAATSAPLPGISVTVYSTAGVFAGSGVSDAAGSYTVGSLAAGTYVALTTNSGQYVNEAYDNLVCVGCYFPSATPINVAAGAVTNNIDFALAVGGSVSGRVIDSASGLPLAGVSVQIGNSSTLLAFVTTDAAGTYTTQTVPAGSYFARVFNSLGYINELWPNVQCLNCSTSTFPIAVTAGATTRNIDFALDAGARLRGKVVDAVTLQPISGVSVSLTAAGGFNVTSGPSDANGDYITAAGVPSGTYYASTFNSVGYIDEMHDNVPCIPSCSTNSGTPLTLTAPGSTTVNFLLDKGGRISGRITDAATGNPVTSALVTVTSATGAFLTNTSTDATGTYQTGSGLPSGSFYVQTSNQAGYINQIYDGVSCTPSCSRTTASPVPVTAGATTTGINFALSRGGRVSGRVTDAATGQPIANGFVSILSGSGAQVSFATTDSTGFYTSRDGIPAGTYYATATATAYLGELYDKVLCINCGVEGGTPIAVSVGATTSGIDFALTRGGRISGRVTDAATGAPVPNASIAFTNAAGTAITGGGTDADGRYISSAGLPAGNYTVRLMNEAGYINQVFDHIACAGFCPSGVGTPVAVALGATTADVDFALTAGGRIEGTVTNAATGSPLRGVSITVQDALGAFFASAQTDGAGHYRTGSGLPAGTYYVRTTNNLGYVDERYDNIPCAGCAATSGTPVAVTLGATRAGVNFALDFGAEIRGTVRDVTTGVPLASVSVVASGGGFSKSGVTDSFGNYIVNGLPAGTYNVRTRNGIGYLDALYDALPCFAGCVPETGVALTLAAGAVRSGINFNLARGGRVSGVVTDAATGLPLSGVVVRIVNAAGTTVANGTSDASGAYITAAGIPTGVYYARTINTAGYVEKMFDGITCSGGCAPSLGTSISVTAAATRSGVSFALRAGGRIAGTVTDSSTGAPVGEVEVDLFDSSGRFVTYGFTDAGGRYVSTSGLPSGTYFAVTYNESGYIDELFGGGVCPFESCAIVAGAPIAVTAGATTGAVDFSLAHGGGIAGRIIDGSTLQPLAGVFVVAFDASGMMVSEGISDAQGNYRTVSGLPPGDYFERTSNSKAYIDRLYDALPGSSSVTSGTPITVTGTATGGVNFVLSPGGRIAGSITDASTAVPLPGITVTIYDAAGNAITSGSTDSSGHYISRAGLAAGSYRARTSNSQGYVNRLFDGLPCLGACATGGGTAIAVSTGATTANVNFTLALGARVSGRVSRAGSGDALPNVTVNLYDGTGALLSSAVTDGLGSYVTRDGVPGGTYYASTANDQGLVNVIYSGMACIAACAPTSGSPIALSAGSTRTAVDFVLGADSDADGDGIANSIDKNASTAADESSVSSNDFNDAPLGGTTSGTILDRGGWTVKIGDLSPGGVQAAIAGAGVGASTIGVCAVSGLEGVVLDAAGETAAISCSAAGSATVRAVVATPLLQLRKPATGDAIVVDLSTGQSATMGSPVVASPENTQPIGVRFVDEKGVTFGSLRLDPGESIEATVIAGGVVQLTVIKGVVTATVNGTTTTLGEGASGTFGSPVDVIDAISRRVDDLLASGDLANQGVARSLHASLDAARKQLGNDRPAARNELQALLTKIETFTQGHQMTQRAHDALAPAVKALLELLR